MSIATVSAMRATRLVRDFPLDFGRLQDPRQPHLVRYPLGGLLNASVAGFASGQATLRDLETFVADASLRARKHLGLSGRDTPSDTTHYNLYARLDPEGFRSVLVEQVRRAVKSSRVENDLMPLGIVAFDGKGGVSGDGAAPVEQARETVYDSEGSTKWFLYMLRAHLVSSSSRICLDQQFIDYKAMETVSFRDMFPRVVSNFPNLFQVVTGDAIFTSKANAQTIVEHGKHYVFGVKANRKRLFDLADAAVAHAPVELETVEKYQGMRVVRRFSRIDCPDEAKFPGARQFIAVAQLRYTPSGMLKSEERRLFITSWSPGELSAAQLMKIVRLHWGIENNANWTMDMVFDDDRRCPCMRGNGSVVVSWLRLLAFNEVALMRSELQTRDKGRPPPWKRVCQLLFIAFFRFDGQTLKVG